MSRSVTVAVAYIMSVTDLSWKEALKVVRAGRAVANPNTGFQKQLQEFENFKLLEERKRLKERYPSLALVTKDQEQCALMLNNYEELLSSKSICEGKCVMGQVCPTGVCRQPTQKRTTRRRSSSRSTSVVSRSESTTSLRPKSGPAGLRSYTGKKAVSGPLDWAQNLISTGNKSPTTIEKEISQQINKKLNYTN